MVVRFVLGRSRIVVQVMAIAPSWWPFVKLPDGLTLDESSFLDVARAVQLAFDTYRQQFRR